MPASADTTAPVVTVVIPTRNRLHYLREACASALAQQLDDLELIVVDDESSDGTAAWLADHEDARLATVRLEQRLERSAARNVGLARAQGRYVLFLDDDDRLLPTSLSLLVDALESEPSAFVAAGRKVVFDDAGNRKPWPHPRRRWAGHPVRDVLFGWVESPGECLWRTEVLRDSGGWREGLSHAEDQELWLRLSVVRPAVVVPDTVLEYRRHGSQVRVAAAAEVEQQLRDEFLANAPHELREQAARAIEGRRRFRRCLDALEQGETTTAFRLALRTLAVVPWTLWSPLAGGPVRHVIVRSAAEALLGRRGRRLAHNLAWKLRQRRGQAIEMQQWAEGDGPP